MRMLLIAWVLSGWAQAAFAICGTEFGPCEIETGAYHADLPDTPEGAPIVIFLHGAGGSGLRVLRQNAQPEQFNARGYAVIAPDGSQTFGQGLSWNFYPGWDGRDEVSFLRSVVQDASHRFGLDGSRVLLAGFSAGAFMVNYAACQHPDYFAAYAPVAGGFWEPFPYSCKGPVRLFHTHGWSDPVVPLEGRPLGNGKFLQGDIHVGLNLWRKTNHCADAAPDGYSTDGPFLRRRWSDCADESALEFALFAGGHFVPTGWADRAVDWFEKVTQPE